MLIRSTLLAAAVMIVGMAAAQAQGQTTGPSSTAPASPAPASSAPSGTPASDSLSVYFDAGSAVVSSQAQQVLDRAAETYRDGKPIIMVVSGGTDSTGSPAANLRLSQIRADNVVQGLVARGIPVERFQVLAKGETEPAVPDPQGTANPRNRRVEISWR